jgi:drug/metabolite transporter (DMT)-like permease
MVSLGSLSVARLGLAGLAATEPGDLAVMLLGGVCNALAFVALTKSLQLTSIVYVNALNATQATMAALAGVLFFHEAASNSLLLGIGLTIVGLLFMRQRKKAA